MNDPERFPQLWVEVADQKHEKVMYNERLIVLSMAPKEQDKNDVKGEENVLCKKQAGKHGLACRGQDL